MDVMDCVDNLNDYKIVIPLLINPLTKRNKCSISRKKKGNERVEKVLIVRHISHHRCNRKCMENSVENINVDVRAYGVKVLKDKSLAWFKQRKVV